jgi:hypothetical protein
MRSRAQTLALVLPFLVGCTATDGPRARWMDRFNPFRPAPETDTAFVKYVVVERPIGGEDINRRVWDRVDEHVLSFESRTMLERCGLRVGTTGESMPGPLRAMIDKPRADRGYRGRSFALDKPISIPLGGSVPRAEFPVPVEDGAPTTFARDDVALGFQIIVKDAGDGKVNIRLVPEARYKDANQLLAGSTGERDVGTELFPAAGIELTLAATDYLVIGTDVYWDRTFGHSAFVDVDRDRPVQRLLVLWAGLTKAERMAPTMLDGREDTAGAPPIASQAGVARATTP